MFHYKSKAGLKRCSAATTSSLPTPQAGLPKPKPETDALTNRAFATEENDWEEDGTNIKDSSVEVR